MYRVDNSTAATTLPTPGAVGPNPNGFFTSGSPASGVAATVVDADWMNAVQEELANACTSTGATLNKTNRAQLAAVLTGRLINVQRILASTTYTPTPGTKSVRIRGGGGGGAGGSAPGLGTGSAEGVAAGGGGAAGYFQWFGPVSALSGAIITIGASGAPAAAGSNTGGAGGATSFVVAGILNLLANGGGGGASAVANTQTIGCPGGSGGSAGAPTMTIGVLEESAVGDHGNPGLWFASTGGSLISGKGGVSRFGGGGNSVAASAGQASSSKSAGGSGASCSTDGTVTSPGYSGGAGGAGYLIIEEYS